MAAFPAFLPCCLFPVCFIEVFLDGSRAALRDELETESWRVSSLRTSLSNRPPQQLLESGVQAAGTHSQQSLQLSGDGAVMLARARPEC